MTAKYVKYLNARREGHDNETANTIAGYLGATPSSVLDMHMMMELFADESNHWGAGPRALRRMMTAWSEELDRIDAQLVLVRRRRSEVARRMRVCDLFLSSKNSDDKGQIHRNFISPVDADDEAG